MAKYKTAPQNRPQKKDKFFISAPKNRKPSSNTGRYRVKPSQSNDRPGGDNSSSGNFFVKPSELKKPSKSNDNADKSPKKPFDKKQWRLQKYSKKYKLQQWEDKRRKGVLREYYKQVKEGNRKFDVAKIYEEEDAENENNINSNLRQEANLNSNLEDNAGEASTSAPPSHEEVEEVSSSGAKRKSKAFKKAHLEFERIKGEKRRKKDEFLRLKAEKEEAMKNYKKDKLKKFKELNKKTKKGQPVMKGRIEMLLEKIQNSMT